MTNRNVSRSLPVVAVVFGLMALAIGCASSVEQATEPGYAGSPASSSPMDRPPAGGPVGPPGVPRPAGADGYSADRAGRPTQQDAPAATAMPALPAAAPTAIPTSGEPQEASQSSSLKSQSDNRQLIVEAWVGLEVQDIDNAVRQVEGVAAQRSGWVESAEIFGEAGYRSASVALRVPDDRLDNALDALRGLGRVTDEGVSSTDVTERLIDNEARLSAWHAQEERLITLLENAPTVEDIIQIEQRISQVRSDIERVEATQRNLTNRVATSLITVNLQLPGRFAADPPHGVIHLLVGNPSATADAVADRVASLEGYVGQKQAYEEDSGPVVDMVVFVKSTDLAQLMDFAATLGSPSGRQLNSVGPSPNNNVPNARLTLSIRSNVDLGAALSLSTAQPMDVAQQIRDQAVSGGGLVQRWNETRHDDHQQVSMELVVKASDLRAIMDFGAGLGDVERWEYNAAGNNPDVDAPNARLHVLVYSLEGLPGVLIAAVVMAAIVAGTVAAAVILLVRRQRRRNPVGAVQDPGPDAGG